MRKIAVTEFLSLDGVMEAPHEWHFPFFDEGAQRYKLDEVMATGALLLGRVTYEGFASAWPQRGEDMQDAVEPTDPASETVFQDRFNWMPKYVVSDSLTDTSWNNSHILRSSEMIDTLRDRKQEDGGDIVIHGSGKLIASLMPTGLIDEYRLMVHPIVVGKGQRLFPEGLDSTTLRLADVMSFDKGTVVLTYASR